MLDLAAVKGSSVWLTVLPLREMGSNLIKQEFCNTVKLQGGLPVDDIPSTYPRVYADIMNTIVFITTVVIAVVVSFI